ncbi:hypothetical protein PMJ46TS7_72920 [Paenibacillus melissococcoides]
MNEGKGDIILRDMDTEYKILNDIDNMLKGNREPGVQLKCLQKKIHVVVVI